jgi:hypothetical protein
MLSPRISSGEEFLGDDQRLGDAVGLGLHRVGERQAPLRAVAEQVPERDAVARRRDDEEFADAGAHQGCERVIDHRLVVDRQQLLAL